MGLKKMLQVFLLGIQTCILRHGGPDLEHPVLRVGPVDGGEAQVRSIREETRRQQVRVMVADPRYLHEYSNHFPFHDPSIRPKRPTVWFPRLMILQTRCVILPLTPVTFSEPFSISNQGPDRDPVGLGVALS